MFDLDIWSLALLTYEGIHIASTGQVWLPLIFFHIISHFHVTVSYNLAWYDPHYANFDLADTGIDPWKICDPGSAKTC